MSIDVSYRPLKLKYAYQVASIASEIIISENIEDKFNPYLWLFNEDHEQYFTELIQRNEVKLHKPNKHSILHDFISDLLVMNLRKHEYWFLDDFYNWSHEEIELTILQYFIEPLEMYIPAINNYRSILVKLVHQFYVNRNRYNKKIQEVISEIIDLHNESRESNKIVDDIFYLLFNDKLFLYHFNKVISKFIIESKLIDIKRVKVPKWLQKGIFFRGNGRCQVCSKDLTGIVTITPDKGMHFDHIIALENGGTNDPTNYQLLCSKCNLKKSTKNIKPTILYQFYW